MTENPAHRAWMDQFTVEEGEEVSAEQLDPASPSSARLGSLKDRKDSVPLSVRLDPEESRELRKIMERNIDTRFDSTSDFVRHYISYGIRETKRRDRDGQFTAAYEASLARRQFQEVTEKINAQYAMIDEAEQTRNRTRDPHLWQYYEKPARQMYENAMTPGIKLALLRVFPELRS